MNLLDRNALVTLLADLLAQFIPSMNLLTECDLGISKQFREFERAGLAGKDGSAWR